MAVNDFGDAAMATERVVLGGSEAVVRMDITEVADVVWLGRE